MKWIHPLIASLLSLGTLPAHAGPSPESGSKEIADEALFVPHSPESGLTMAMPGWMAGLDGTIGVRGLDTAVDVGFDKIST